MIGRLGLSCIGAFAACSVAVAAPPREPTEIAAPSNADVQAAPAKPALVRKIAIGRFTNTTRYGKALLLDGDKDPLAAQAADMLTARLVDSRMFLVFERSDLSVLAREQEVAGFQGQGLTGVDVLVIGSVTEFGRKTEGKQGFLTSKIRQVATATVEVRLVDVQTGRAFFSTSGAGSASVEMGETLGFGSAAAYDSTLNDSAISAAISNLTDNVIQRLSQRPWFTDVLQVRGETLLISGGPSQGLRIGDRYRVELQGDLVTSGQTGLPIRLPGERVATIEVVSFFGDDPTSEGAVTKLISGRVAADQLQRLVVLEEAK